MQDFLAGGAVGQGYYTELQSGLKPTQQQVFTLPPKASVSFTEYFKGRSIPVEAQSGLGLGFVTA